MIKQTPIELEARATQDTQEAARLRAAATELAAYVERFGMHYGVEAKGEALRLILRQRADELEKEAAVKVNLANRARKYTP